MKEKNLYRLGEYAKLMKVTPAAVTKMISSKRVKVVLENGQRFIEA